MEVLVQLLKAVVKADKINLLVTRTEMEKVQVCQGILVKSNGSELWFEKYLEMN